MVDIHSVIVDTDGRKVRTRGWKNANPQEMAKAGFISIPLGKNTPAIMNELGKGKEITR